MGGVISSRSALLVCLVFVFSSSLSQPAFGSDAKKNKKLVGKIPNPHKVERPLPISEVGHLRVRAREFAEWLFVRYGASGNSASYFGFANLINIWYEKRMRYSFGLVGGPVFGTARSSGVVPAGTAKKIQLWTFGVEGKYFPYPGERGLFARMGISGNVFETDGNLGTLGGFGYLVSLGWEIVAWKGKLGISPEFAFRQVFLDDGGADSGVSHCSGIAPLYLL